MTHPLRMRFRLPAVAVMVAAALLLPAAAHADVVPGQVIVGYTASSSPADRSEARSDVGTKPIEGLGMARTQLLQVTDGDSVAATVRQLEAQPGVAYAEPNGIMRLASVPNDPDFSQQWGLFNDGQSVNPTFGNPGTTGTIGDDIGAPQAWNIQTGDPNTVVAVMDTGADLTHPDLQNELWTDLSDGSHGYDFYDNPPGSQPPTDKTGHGTHVSGIIAAQGDNGIDTTGVAQHASLMELKICGTYSAGCPVSDEVDAINYAGAHGARVLNGSIQGGTYFQSLATAINNNPNVLYVFAAGNSSQNDDNTPTYPCAIDQGPDYVQANNVICVAATDQNDQLAGFSNYGASSVDLGAPGVNILSSSSQKTFFSDDFESGFGQWTNTAGPGWSVVSEPPLNQPPFDPSNNGITDAPVAGPPAPGTVTEATSNAVTMPSGYSTCELDYYRALELASGDTFKVDVLLDGSPTAGITYTSSNSANHTARNNALTLNTGFDPGGQVQVRLQLTSDGSGGKVHMDNINLICHGSPSDASVDPTLPTSTEFLSGTSMAAPMVSGAAALLFSQTPGASASEVKTELLNSVDPVPSLAGKTVTGGRLDVYRALTGDFNPAGGGGSGSSGGGGGSTGSPRKPNTFFEHRPGRVVRTQRPSAKVVFRFGSDEAGSGFECNLDGFPYVPCTKKYSPRLLPGRHVLKVKAVASGGSVDPSAAVAKFRIKQIGG